MRRSKTSNSQKVLKNFFNSLSFLKILRAICLGGVIEEFAIIISDGIGTIAAIDPTASLFAFATGKIGDIKNASLGIKDGSFLIKAIEANSSEQISYTVEDNRWFKINIPAVGDIKILLSPPDQIPTSILEYQEPIADIKSGIQTSFILQKEFADKAIFSQNFVKNETTRIFLQGAEVYLGSGQYETRTFSVKIGEITPGEISEDFSATIKGEHFASILSSILWDEEAPVVGLGEENPIIITQGENFMWSLSQSSEKG